jgi:hypothetical protein
MRRLAVAAVAVVLAASFGSLALAQGKGKGKGNNPTASVAFTLGMVTDNNSDGLPNWGDQVTFNVSTPDTNDPHVQLICSQNGEVVYGASWPITPVLTLRSDVWQGGAADCTATAYYITDGTKKVPIGSLNFPVGQ